LSAIRKKKKPQMIGGKREREKLKPLVHLGKRACGPKREGSDVHGGFRVSLAATRGEKK